MAEVSWIKIKTDMFDDNKIKIIQSMPEGDAMLVIWIRLITLGGATNDDGYVYLAEGLPYTDEMLATIFNKPLQTIRLALSTFQKLQMIDLDTKGIYIVNFAKHQSIDRMKDIREYNRVKQQESRERRKLLLDNGTKTLVNDSVNDTPLTVNQNVNTDIDKDKEEDIEKDIKNTNKQTSFACDNKLSPDDMQKIVHEWNSISSLSKITKITPTSTRHKLLKARAREHTVEEIIQAIHEIAKSEFLQGKNDKGWTITFDWFLKPNNFPKVLEGQYTTRQKQAVAMTKPKNSAFTSMYNHDHDFDELERSAMAHMKKTLYEGDGK